IVKQNPIVFDNHFKAGLLKISPQRLLFRNDSDKLKPRCTRFKALSHKELSVVQDWLQSALDKGIIDYSESSWRSSIFPVMKPSVWKDGVEIKQWRMVTPFFNLNPLLNVRGLQMPSLKDIQAEI